VSPIDDEALDRLADFTAGVLDPTEAAHVQVLIDTDPDWASAYAGLTGAGARLDAALSGLADPPLPADVAARLSAAIERESRPEDTRTATVVPISTHRRWARRSAWAGAAAAVLVAVSVGVLQFVTPASQNNATSGAAALSGTGTSDQWSASGTLQIVHSGQNYTPQTVGQVTADSLSLRPPVPAASEKAPAAPVASALANGTTGGDEPEQLDRLLGPAPLRECLNAIVQRYGGTPVVADYASFDGAPALIVVLALPPASRRIVVAGPRCGLPGMGPDERYSVVK
jgi:hypothetical protein